MFADYNCDLLRDRREREKGSIWQKGKGLVIVIGSGNNN